MLFSQLAFEQACPNNRFLEEMHRCVPWNLFESELKQNIIRKSGGRPPYPLLLQFKMYLLKTWYNLSDSQCEFQCRDSLSFKRFLGLTIEANVPDATTLENFRHDFEPIAERVFLKLDALFEKHGLFVNPGNIVDATFVKANCRPHKGAEKNSDIDADHGKKGFGYTNTINMHAESKLIRREHTENARPHDSQHLDNVLMGTETALYGDSGYTGCEELLAEKGCKARIVKRRKRGKKGQPTPSLSLRDKYMNRLIVKTRVRVEHAFACFKTVFRVVRTSYRGLERVSVQMTMVALAYNLRRFGYLSRA
jgi:transposase, IS5 family